MYFENLGVGQQFRFSKRLQKRVFFNENTKER